MSRYFAIQTWVGSHENEPDYNGQQTGSRDFRSLEIPTFDRNGKANMKAFSDDAINARKESRKSSIPLKDLILPQAARVERLTQQMKDLVEEYKQGMHTPEEYTLLLDVLAAKRDRAVELLNKAKNTKPKPLHDEAVSVNQEEENVDFGGDFSTQKAKKKLESCVFLGACVLACIVMLMMSH